MFFPEQVSEALHKMATVEGEGRAPKSPSLLAVPSWSSEPPSEPGPTNSDHLAQEQDSAKGQASTTGQVNDLGQASATGQVDVLAQTSAAGQVDVLAQTSAAGQDNVLPTSPALPDSTAAVTAPESPAPATATLQPPPHTPVVTSAVPEGPQAPESRVEPGPEPAPSIVEPPLALEKDVAAEPNGELAATGNGPVGNTGSASSGGDQTLERGANQEAQAVSHCSWFLTYNRPSSKHCCIHVVLELIPISSEKCDHILDLALMNQG